MTTGGREWIAGLPGELAGQQRLLRRLVDACESDGRFRWLVVACSVGRGAADRLSDLDLGLGVADAEFEQALGDVRGVVDGLGDLVDSYHHQLPGFTLTHERIFAQYADRCQVDLVVVPATQTVGPVKDQVVLYDPDSQISGDFEQQQVTPRQAREWAFGAWCALADLGKYLRRGSAWEALARLHEARDQLWRLRAAASDVPNPQFGLTSMLDFAPAAAAAVTPRMSATVADLDPGRLLEAARSLAGQLAGIGAELPPELAATLPEPMGRFVTRDLAALDRPG